MNIGVAASTRKDVSLSGSKRRQGMKRGDGHAGDASDVKPPSVPEVLDRWRLPWGRHDHGLYRHRLDAAVPVVETDHPSLLHRDDGPGLRVNVDAAQPRPGTVLPDPHAVCGAGKPRDGFASRGAGPATEQAQARNGQAEGVRRKPAAGFRPQRAIRGPGERARPRWGE